MLGRIHTAASFRQKLAYCLNDKKLTQSGETRPEQKDRSVQDEMPGQTVAYKDRAEILYCNLCHGKREELTRQFNEVARQDLNMGQPVMHISISFPPGERLPKGSLVDLACECAQHFGFQDHQFVAILHKDTSQQHFHMVANRVGFDRHTVSDSYSKGRMADFCRAAEIKHHLIRELGPRRYQTKEQRLIPRQGQRIDRLKENIREALKISTTYPEFRQRMQENGYTVYDTRGIAFMDDKDVVIRGSEAGFSRRIIENTLANSLQQSLLQQQQQELRQRQQPEEEHTLTHRLKIY